MNRPSRAARVAPAVGRRRGPGGGAFLRSGQARPRVRIPPLQVLCHIRQDSAGGALCGARGPRAGNTTRTMDDRERLQWLPARARRIRAAAWGITLLNTLPLIAACLLALLLGRPGIAAGAMALVLFTLGLVHALTRPRRLAMARIRPGLREVRRSH